MKHEVVAHTRIIELPLMSVEVVLKVLAFLNGLARTGATPMVPPYLVLVIYPTAAKAPQIDKDLRVDAFSHLLLGSVKDDMEHELLRKFLKMKPQTF